MWLNPIAGGIGLIAQLALAVGTTLMLVRRRGLTESVVYAGAIAVFGLPLAMTLLLFAGIPWQATDGLLAIAIIVATCAPRMRRALLDGWHVARRGLRAGWPAIAVATLLAAYQFGIDLLKPVVDIDGQLYHGPTLAQIVQHASLWGWSMPNQYLAYTDLTAVSGVNLATFTGSTVFDDAIQVPHLILLVAAIMWVLAGSVRSPFARAGLATLIVSAPVVWMQARVLYVDLAYATAIVIAAGVLLGRRPPRAFDALIGGIAVAAVVSTKPQGLLTGALLAFAIAIVMIVRMRRRVGNGRAVGWTLIGLLAPLVAGSAFYLRNLIAFHNPVFPIAFHFGPISFDGIIDFSVFNASAGGGIVAPSRLGDVLHSIWEGTLQGVTKLDYDPRDGGFGWIPGIVIAIAVVIVIAQWASLLRRRNRLDYPRERWIRQSGLVAVALAIIMIQPMANDVRYIIAPVTLGLCAVLMTRFTVEPIRALELTAAFLAIGLACAQIAWTEWFVYPGARSVWKLHSLPAIWQPLTPGNPWGISEADSWVMHTGEDCTTIALETSGGLNPAGLDEKSLLATFPYGLYGPHLCNDIEPIVLRHAETKSMAALEHSRYLVLYADHVKDWEARLDLPASCLRAVGGYSGNVDYPQKLTVLEDACG